MFVKDNEKLQQPSGKSAGGLKSGIENRLKSLAVVALIKNTKGHTEPTKVEH